MLIDLHYQPAYALAVVRLDQGESIRAEPDAMVTMSGNIDVQTGKASRGGILKSLKGAFFGGENFFINTFTAKGSPGEVTFAPRLPGDMRHIRLDGEMIVSQGAFLAADPAVEYDAKWTGAKSFFSGEGLFMLKVEGQGDLVICSFGAIEEIEVDGKYTIDTGHIVGFTKGLDYKIRRFGGGWKSFFLSGEGLVAEFSGKGTLYAQSRNQQGLTSWLTAVLPAKKQS